MGVGDGQASLVCCSPWGLKELDTTEQLNELNMQYDPSIYLNNTIFLNFICCIFKICPRVLLILIYYSQHNSLMEGQYKEHPKGKNLITIAIKT